MKTIWKSTLREIKESFGRFIAILAIVALGVGFFAGLKVTRAAMVETTGNYLEEQGFYDYRLVSTLGFGQEEVEYLGQQEGVRGAEGAVSFDVICQDAAGNESVMKVHSITEQLNRLVVLKGRMPQGADECVADANLFTETRIGETLTLSENNSEEDLQHFVCREYTVVGIVQSPNYIQYERGNTSLGTGRVSGFLYLNYEGFDVDYYTEIFVKFAEAFPLFSDEYQDFIAEKEPVWEDCLTEAADTRYRRVSKEAEEKLADARTEFDTEKADAEQELAEAWVELEDAREQLADGERQLADAREELAEARKTVADKTKELAEGELEIADAEQELAEGEQTLREGLAEWNKGNERLSEAERELAEGRGQLEEQKAALTAGSEEIAAGEQALAEAERELQLKEEELSQGRQGIQEMEQQLKAMLEAGILSAESAEAKAFAAQIQAAKDQLAAYEAQFREGKAQLAQEQARLEAGRAAIAEGWSLVAVYEQKLLEGQEEIDRGNDDLDAGWEKLEAGERELVDGRTALEDARAQLADGKKQLADAGKEIEEAEQTISDKERELAEGREEYADGLAEYEEGVKEFDEKIGDAQRELEDAEQEIADLKEPDSYLLGRDTNVGYACFENDSAIVEGIANIFPVFFFLVAALVCITTMNRMVEEQRTQIGVLKALGYSEGVIMSKYMFYSDSAAVIGCIIGYAGGTWLFPRVIWTAYGIMYRVDTLVYVFDWKLAVISLAVSVLCSVGTTWLSCRVELKEVAAQLMRPKSPKAGKRVFLEYVTVLWKRLGFLRKVSIRNIFRYKKRLVMMVMGISGCTALLVTGFGIKDSIAEVAVQQFEEIQTYDLNVLFSEDISEELLERMDSLLESAENGTNGETVTGDGTENRTGVRYGVDDGTENRIGVRDGTDDGTVTAGGNERYAAVYETTFDLVTADGRKSVNLLAFDGETDMTLFLDLHTADDEPIAFPAVGELVITDKIAKDYGITVGDTVTLQNEDMQTITAKVSGINQNFIYNYVYINGETYRDQTGEEAGFRNLYLNLPEDADMHLVAAALMKWEEVANVTVNADTMERFSSMMRSLDLIVVFVIACAAGLAFIVLYNLTNINITERIREIATIKVLGFHKRETASYVFRENMVLAAMGIAAGLPLGHLLHLFVMNEIHIDMIAFDIRVRPVSYFYSVILTYLFAWLVNLLMGGKLEKISMTESLKSVD